MPLRLDAREFHVDAAEWTPDGVTFHADGEQVRAVEQSPNYPLQLMLGIYEFEHDDSAYPKEFVVDSVRGYRLR